MHFHLPILSKLWDAHYQKNYCQILILCNTPSVIKTLENFITVIYLKIYVSFETTNDVYVLVTSAYELVMTVYSVICSGTSGTWYDITWGGYHVILAALWGLDTHGQAKTGSSPSLFSLFLSCNKMHTKGMYRWVSARETWLQCISNGVTSFLHSTIPVD